MYFGYPKTRHLSLQNIFMLFFFFFTSDGLLDSDSQKLPHQLEKQFHCSCQDCSAYSPSSQALTNMLIYRAKMLYEAKK